MIGPGPLISIGYHKWPNGQSSRLGDTQRVALREPCPDEVLATVTLTLWFPVRVSHHQLHRNKPLGPVSDPDTFPISLGVGILGSLGNFICGCSAKVEDLEAAKDYSDTFN